MCALVALLFAVGMAESVSRNSSSDSIWDDDGAAFLLQINARRELNSLPIGTKITNGNIVNFERDEPRTWPEELQYPMFDIPIPIRIFVWSMAGFIPETHTGRFGNCTVDAATRDPGVFPMHIPDSPDYDISDADVVIFALPDMVYDFPANYILPREKKASQMWVSTCEEPYKRPGLEKPDCRLMHDPATMEFMDVTSSYSFMSDIPVFIESVYPEDLRRKPPDFSIRPSNELATVAVSDCTSDWRNQWLLEVMAEINSTGHRVLSYGKCFHNAEESGEVGGQDHSSAGWIQPTAARPFKLVAENALEPWYVTEKIWDALAEGAVPVYLGPPEVKKMLPQGSFLYVDDFPSTKSLVQRMINFTPEDFAKAHAWRQKPTSEWGMWEKIWRHGRHTMLNRFCEYAAKQKLEGTPFKSGETPPAHDLPCCPADRSCCMNQ